MLSKPLLFQSIKSNWILWLVCSLTMAAMISIINIVLGTQSVTTFRIDTLKIFEYTIALARYNLSIVGLIEALGFNPKILDVWLDFNVNDMMDGMYYTVGCMLIPMIYVVITSNKLLVDQVDRGSMAYVLSTPTKRSKVVVTQMFYLIISVLGIFIIQAAAGIISQIIVSKTVDVWRVLLLNFGAAVVTLAIAGICFLGSAYFNYSKYSYAFGGGLCVFFFLAKVLGLFGDPMFVTVGLGVESMGYFNYMSILSLLDTKSIAELSFTFIWKFAILLVIAGVTFGMSVYVFNKKDLSL